MSGKKATLFIGLIMALLAVGSLPAGTYSGGSGDPNDPYLIADANDWLELTQTVSDWSSAFELIADIDLVGVSLTPIGNGTNTFSGTLNGNSHTLSNATMNLDELRVGLFGYVQNGEISYLNLENVNIATSSQGAIGGLSATNREATIHHCNVTGAVSFGSNGNLGGLVGGNNCSVISDCHVTVTLISTGANYIKIGGLIGSNSTLDDATLPSTVNNCSASATITVSDGTSYICRRLNWIKFRFGRFNVAVYGQ